MSLRWTNDMKNYQEVAQEARKKVLEMIYKAQTSHIGSNLSVIDIATVLYEKAKPQDKIIWSKGWAAATAYYFLSRKGIIPERDLGKIFSTPQPPTHFFFCLFFLLLL